MKTIRIFISSPGDVAEERERARQVIDSLKRRYAGVFQLKPVLWEDLPLQADMSFQQGIDVVLSSTGIDLAIFILWSRLGSPQGGAARRPDGTPYRSGTERELDLMLEARRQSGGTRPDMLVYTRQDDASFTERLRGKSTQQQEIEITQKKLVESFITEEFQDVTQGVNLRAFHSFDRPQAFSGRLRTHLIELLDAMAGGNVGEAVWDIDTQGPPFMGLEAFGEKQALVFCGRDSEILEARRALAAQAREGCAFLLLTGASGSGKSSLARAGLLPAIAEHELDETVAEWRTLSITPSELGADPIAGLVARLAAPGLLPELRAEGSSPADISHLLQVENPARAVGLLIKRAIAEASQKRKGGVRILLLIDQLEELLVMEKRTSILAALEALARSSTCWVVATVRGDFLGEIQKSATLVRMMSGQGLFPVLAPDADALRRMIEEPARLAGLHFEEKDDRRLSDRILADAARHADLLPLVEHVLRQLFDQRTANGALTWQTYETLGGVEGALSQHADAVLRKLPVTVQATLPAVLKRLVTLSETTGGVEDGGERLIRQRVDLATFLPETPIRQLVDAFIPERLLTATRGEGDRATVTLAHEALLRVWPTAAAWAGQNSDILRIRARIEARMTEGSPLLKGDPLLDAAKALLLTHTEDFTPAQRTWIEAALTAAEEKERRANRRRRLAFTALSILTVLALSGAGWALKRQEDAKTAEIASREAEAFARQAETSARHAETLARAAEAIARDAEANARDAESRAEDRRLAAMQSEEKAQRARATAEGLINSMLYDLRDKLQSFGRLELLDDVSRKTEKYFEENPPETPQAKREMAVMWQNRGDVHLAEGDLAAARQAYQQSIEIARGLARDYPHVADVQLDWSLWLSRLGIVAVAEGNLAAAREAYQQSLEIAKRLAEADPQNVRARSTWSESLNNLGDVAVAEGDLAAARQAYQQSLEIAKRLAEADPSDTAAQRIWSIPLYKLGDLALAEGDLAAARQAYQQSLEIDKRLAEADLRNAKTLRAWSVSLSRLGNVALAEGDLTAARQAYQQSQEINQRLAEADPRNAGIQRNWSVALIKLGDVAVAEGDMAAARRAYQQSMEIFGRLAEADPRNAGAQSDWSYSLDKFGDAAVAERHMSAARQAYQQSLAIRERLAKADPRNAGAQRDWSVSLYKFGDLALAEGDLATARQAYQQSLEISSRQAEVDPRNTKAQRDWSISLYKCGDVAVIEGKLALARQAYQQSLEIRERLAEDEPRNAGDQRALYETYWEIAELLEKQDDSESFDWWRKAHQQITAMHERGILAPADHKLLDFLREKSEGSEH